MDLEQDFICALCSANKADQRRVDQAGITPSQFLGFGAEAEYMWEYRDKYHKFPDATVLRKHFPRFEVVRVSEPFTYYVDQFIERDQFQKLQKVMSKVNKHLKAQSFGGVQEALKEMVQAQAILKKGYSGDVSWSQWDAVKNYSDREKCGSLWLTPYASLNKMIRGLRPKNLVTLVARPSMGKTWLALTFASCFRRQGANVLIISKEMGTAEIYERLDAIEFQLRWIDYLEGKLPLFALQKLRVIKREHFKKYPAKLVVSDSEDLESSGLSAVDAKIVEHNPDVVIVDGAYLMEEAKSKSFVEGATRLSRGTKRIAKHRNVLLMQTLQMGRKAEDEEATLAHISWADAYGQDSDYVFYLKGKPTDDMRIVELLKGRTLASGGIGEFYVNAKFDPVVDLKEASSSSSKMLLLSPIEG